MAKKNKDVGEKKVISEAPQGEECQEEQEQPPCEQTTDEVEQLKQKLAEGNDKLLRVAAEYENFRKRTQKEKDELYSASKASVVKELLPVLDNFERAAMNSQAGLEDYKKGVEMTFNQFTEILKKLGIEKFGTVGDEFDPSVHSAVMHVEDEEFAENSVAEVFEKGYKMGEKVIRFAVVKVAN